MLHFPPLKVRKDLGSVFPLHWVSHSPPHSPPSLIGHLPFILDLLPEAAATPWRLHDSASEEDTKLQAATINCSCSKMAPISRMGVIWLAGKSRDIFLNTISRDPAEQEGWGEIGRGGARAYLQLVARTGRLPNT